LQNWEFLLVGLSHDLACLGLQQKKENLPWSVSFDWKFKWKVTHSCIHLSNGGM
jgi:hypothetical protein